MLILVVLVKMLMVRFFKLFFILFDFVYEYGSKVMLFNLNLKGLMYV